MTDHTGKLTEHLWLPKRLCVDPEMAKEIRDLAKQEYRKMQDQIRWLIMLGLEESRRRQTVAARAKDKKKGG
jgi:hypothetical protein